MTGDQPSFLTELFPNVSAIPRRGWLLGVLAAILLTAPEFAERSGLGAGSALSRICTGLGLVVWIAGAYVGAMGIIGRSSSVIGGAKFLLAYVLMIAPLLALMFAVLAIQEGQSPGLTAVWLLGILFACAAVMLLAAWPVAASLLPGLVSPVRILQATKGYRWGLVCASLVAASGNRMAPDVVQASDSGTAAFYGLVGVFLTVFAFALSTSTAGTAWDFAARNDKGLVG